MAVKVADGFHCIENAEGVRADWLWRSQTADLDMSFL